MPTRSVFDKKHVTSFRFGPARVERGRSELSAEGIPTARESNTPRPSATPLKRGLCRAPSLRKVAP